MTPAEVQDALRLALVVGFVAGLGAAGPLSVALRQGRAQFNRWLHERRRAKRCPHPECLLERGHVADHEIVEYE